MFQTSSFKTDRLTVVLRRPYTTDEQIRELASMYGTVTSVERATTNERLLFLVYENSDCVVRALEGLQQSDLFYLVDYAPKSDRKPIVASAKKPDVKHVNKPVSDSSPPKSSTPEPAAADAGEVRTMQPKRSDQSNLLFHCTACPRLPYFQCQCGAFYCDVKCQQRDWSAHKAVCMPRLISIPQFQWEILSQQNGQSGSQQQRNYSSSSSSEDGQLLLEEEGRLEPGPFPKLNSQVKISSWLPSGEVFIYEDSPSMNSEYNLLTTKLYKAAVAAKPLETVPQVNDIIFAPFHGQHFRAKVLAVDDGGKKIDVQYVDFGNKQTVSWNKSREIADKKLKWAPYYTYPVLLEGIDKLPAPLQNVLSAFEGASSFELVSITEDQDLKRVVLKFTDKPLLLNTHLLEVLQKEQRMKMPPVEQYQGQQKHMGKLRPGKKGARLHQETTSSDNDATTRRVIKVPDPETYKPVLFDRAMETKSLPLDSELDLLVIDASEALETELISVIEARYAQEYAQVLKDCATFGKADPNLYKPSREGEVCLALYQQEWSRALYDKADNKYMLLDVGTIVSVPVINIRRFPSELSRVIYNNEVLVANMGALKSRMTGGKPENCHGKVLKAVVRQTADADVVIRIVD